MSSDKLANIDRITPQEFRTLIRRADVATRVMIAKKLDKLYDLQKSQLRVVDELRARTVGRFQHIAKLRRDATWLTKSNR